ncbi:MAG: hypothetical protein JSS62_03145 [Verrucomicrobia bacterium]|nr:hypothetical protein [Verrucomicrobiota bacterium]MBS0646666.1 hypothetical protein [Verrucomicrobiota bacterium]
MRSFIFIFSIFCLLRIAWAAEEVASDQPFLETEQTETIDLEIETELALEESIAEQNEAGTLTAAVDNLGPGAAGFTAEGDIGPDADTMLDPRVLRDFIESRGLIKCRQKEGNLIIAGDVRARWTTQGESLNGIKQRGTGTNTALNTFRSEVNLFLDYTAPKAWVTNKLRWVNYDGSDGGTATKTETDRAFIGYDIYHCGDDVDCYIEVGRTRLDYLYESRVEFSTFFDGIHLFYQKKIPTIGQFTIHGGPFVIDSFTNHYGWAMETFVNRWAGTGFSFKYSIINWNRSAPTLDYGNLTGSGNVTIANNPRYAFLVSQMLFGYERKIGLPHCKTLYAYAAVLCNHNARPSKTTNSQKLNNAWYAGFTLGKLCKACDWSLDVIYQSVQAQAVPEFDLAGIGHGNAANTLLSDAILLGLPPGVVGGFANYRGWEVSFLYAMTDSLSLRAKAAHSTPRDSGIGGDFNYKVFDMSVIFAF